MAVPGTLVTANGEYGIAGSVPGQILWPTTPRSGSIVSSLPDDILFMIFNHIYDLGDTTSSKNTDILAVSWVCRGWRIIATESARLWTRISLHDMDRAVAFLGRSGRMPVHLRVNAGVREPARDDMGAILSPHLGRIQALRMADLTHRTLGRWMSYFRDNGSLDSLEVLELSVFPGTKVRGRLDTMKLTDTDGEYFRCDTPSLQHLTLLGVLYSPSSTFYNNLSSLVIAGTGATSITLERLLRVLARSPNLSRFALSNVTIKDLEYDSDPEDELPPFPRLTHLALAALDCDAAEDLLDHLVVPAGLTSFLCDGFSLPIPPQRLSPSVMIRRFVFERIYGLCARGHGCTRVSAFGSRGFCAPTVDFYLPAGERAPCLDRAVRWLTPNICGTEEMTLINLRTSYVDWRQKVFPMVPALKTLRLVGCERGTISLLKALATERDELYVYTGRSIIREPYVPDMPCRQLESLEICEHPHSRTAYGEWGPPDPEPSSERDPGGEFWTALEAAVVWRRKVGFPLRSVSLFDVARPADEGVLRRIRAAVAGTFEVYVPVGDSWGERFPPGRLRHPRPAWRKDSGGLRPSSLEGLPFERLDVDNL